MNAKPRAVEFDHLRLGPTATQFGFPTLIAFKTKSIRHLFNSKKGASNDVFTFAIDEKLCLLSSKPRPMMNFQ